MPRRMIFSSTRHFIFVTTPLGSISVRLATRPGARVATSAPCQAPWESPRTWARSTPNPAISSSNQAAKSASPRIGAVCTLRPAVPRVSGAKTTRSRHRSSTTALQYRPVPPNGCSSTIGVPAPDPYRRTWVGPNDVAISVVTAGWGDTASRAA